MDSKIQMRSRLWRKGKQGLVIMVVIASFFLASLGNVPIVATTAGETILPSSPSTADNTFPTSTQPDDFSFIAYVEQKSIEWVITDPDFVLGVANWMVACDGVPIESGMLIESPQEVIIDCIWRTAPGTHVYSLNVDDGYLGTLWGIDEVYVTALDAEWACDITSDNYFRPVQVTTDSTGNLVLSSTVQLWYLGNQYGEVAKDPFQAPEMWIDVFAQTPETSLYFIQSIQVAVKGYYPSQGLIDPAIWSTIYQNQGGALGMDSAGTRDPIFNYVIQAVCNLEPYGVFATMWDATAFNPLGVSVSIIDEIALFTYNLGQSKTQTGMKIHLPLPIDGNNHGTAEHNYYRFEVTAWATQAQLGTIGHTDGFNVYNPAEGDEKAPDFTTVDYIPGIEIKSVEPVTPVNWYTPPNSYKVSVKNTGNVLQNIHFDMSVAGSFYPNNIMLFPGKEAQVTCSELGRSSFTITGTSYSLRPYNPANLGPWYDITLPTAVTPISEETPNLNSWAMYNPSPGYHFANIGVGTVTFLTFAGYNQDWWPGTYLAPFIARMNPSTDYNVRVRVQNPSSIPNGQQVGLTIFSSFLDVYWWGFFRDTWGGYYLKLEAITGGTGRTNVWYKSIPSSVEYIALTKDTIVGGVVWSFWYYNNGWVRAYWAVQSTVFIPNAFLGIVPTAFGLVSKEWGSGGLGIICSELTFYTI